MTENAPPVTTTANGAIDPSRGMPYYEKLRRDLRETLQKKRVLDANLAKLEDNIYNLETSYLEDTTAGNIIRGFDNYIKGGTAVGGGAGSAATRRRTGINDSDRIFSRSSVSFLVCRIKIGFFPSDFGADKCPGFSSANIGANNTFTRTNSIFKLSTECTREQSSNTN